MGLEPHDPAILTRITRDEHSALLIAQHIRPDTWRATLQRITTHLDRLTDPRRWLILLHCSNNGPLAIACWLSSTKGPRLAVLHTTPPHILDSDAQTVAALATAWHPDPSLTCLRWHELLGRHAIGRRFFRALDTHVTDIAAAFPTRVAHDDRRTLALIHVARLLFLKFLEAKGWLNDDRTFLARQAEHTLDQHGHLWSRLIAPLTFGTLNTPHRHRAPTARTFGAIPFLNGGLFATSTTERRARHPALHDEQLAPLLLDTLARFRFTAREDTRTWSEAAIDPDLLGRTFEALMDTSVRRGTGTFYTPGALVTTLVDDALEHALDLPHELARAALAHTPLAPADTARVLASTRTLRILDPACGSGSLLVATLERLAALRHTLGDPGSIASLRRETLTRSIFGVDIAPMAVWLCELRLWLSVVIDDDTTDTRSITPLPNLDHHIRIGDSLGVHAFDDAGMIAQSARLATLRERYARSAGSRKRTLAARIDAAEQRNARRIAAQGIATLRTERADLLHLARQRTLFGTRQGLSATQRRRLAALRLHIAELRRSLRRLDDGATADFDFRTHFSDAASAGGFDLVIGNPPWVRSHHLDHDTRRQLRDRFGAVMRHTDPHAAFGTQSDIAIPFTQRGLQLTRPGGVLAFLLPAKHWRSVAGSALRHHLLSHTHPLHLRDHSHDAGGFSAAVYPSTIVMRRTTPTDATADSHPPRVHCHATDAAGTAHDFTIDASALAATSHTGAPWRIIPDAVRTAADTLHHAGHRWMDSILPPPALGIKTGCNDAYLISMQHVPAALRPWVRPVLRGDQVRAWHSADASTGIVVPADKDGRMLARLPAALSRHFTPHERALLARTDLRPREPWWTLFRTDLLAPTGWRVIWADIGRTLRATILPPHAPAVPLNSCYGVRLHDPIDAHALATLLNAPSTTAWLSLVAEPARGGYHRFLGWTVLALPLPDWQLARERLAPLAARARRGEPVNIETLHHTTLECYGLQHADIAPLMQWTSDALRAERVSRDTADVAPTATATLPRDTTSRSRAS